ncbi:MAG TPA: hypothetical protein VH280_25500 [Verrucomicrobiae bacterium]|jgi:hypothetical protein|nr:hypothetical protein [Verrucomicrobiae bacterium]
MKCWFFSLLCISFASAGLGQTPYHSPFANDPKGLRLPPGEPRIVDTNGNVEWIDQDYTSEKYQTAAFKLVLQEANQVAEELQLPESLPITESNIVEAFIPPFGYDYMERRIGNVTTTNYTYYISRADKFSFLDDMHQSDEWKKYKSLYTWPVARMETNAAYVLATQWLGAVSMDVNGLNRDCQLTVELDSSFHSAPGDFVPVYFVYWKRRDLQMGATATVRVCVPAKRLLELRVEDERYILRKPIVVENLDLLLPGPTVIMTNYPSKGKPVPVLVH